MGEENKESEGNNNASSSPDEGEKKELKKEEEEIVLKVDMHCEGCAKKVVRAITGFQGVEGVAVDRKANNVVVKGKSAEPAKLCQRIQKKTGRKAQIVSPLPRPPEPQHVNKDDPSPKDGVTQDQPPEVITVVLRVQIHCEACAQILRKRIRKIKGVESVETDVANDQIRVKGTIGDPASLVNYVSKKTKKQVSILVKDNDQEIKKDDKASDDKKKEEADDTQQVNKESDQAVEAAKQKQEVDIDKMRNQVIRPYEYAYAYADYYWPRHNYVDYNSFNHHHPQVFSDENPNACTIM